MTMPAVDGSLQWIKVEDFSPGIWATSDSQFALTSKAPLGAAQPEYTFGCIAYPGGGLGPLPASERGYGWLSLNAATIKGADTVVGSISVGGFEAFSKYINSDNPASANNDPRFIVGLSYYTSSNLKPRVALLSNGGTTALVDYDGAGQPSWLDPDAGSQKPHAFFMFVPMRTNANGGTPTNPGYNVIFFAAIPSYVVDDGTVGFDALTVQGQFSSTPKATGATVDVWGTSSANQSISGLPPTSAGGFYLFGHQNRLCAIMWDYKESTHPLQLNAEVIAFTDPPNLAFAFTSTAYAAFAPENPVGYGVFASINAGALLLVKHGGGAVLVEGDFKAPRATNLPGVQSTYGIVTNPNYTMYGVVYASANNGVWAWNGGPTSVKLSKNLPDDFFRLGSEAETYFFPTGHIPGGPSFSAVQWDDWLVVSGGWIMDVNGSWWRLVDPTVANYNDLLHFRVLSLPGDNFLVGSYVRLEATTGTINFAASFSRQQLATSWKWRSQPIFAGHNKTLEVREVVIRAQRDETSTGTSTITLTVLGDGGATVSGPHTVNITSQTRPELIRIPCQCRGDQIEIQFESANNNVKPAPILHEFMVGYIETDEGPQQ